MIKEKQPKQKQTQQQLSLNTNCQSCLNGQLHFRTYGCAIDRSDDIDCQAAIEKKNGAETEALTQQQFRDECDVGNIMKRFEQTGQIMTGANGAKYGDFSDVDDYHTALNKINEARESFMELPAQIRKRFSNDPGQLIDFLNDGNNLEEAIKLGLVDPINPPNPEPAKETKDPKGSAPTPT